MVVHAEDQYLVGVRWRVHHPPGTRLQPPFTFLESLLHVYEMFYDNINNSLPGPVLKLTATLNLPRIKQHRLAHLVQMVR